MDTLSRTFMPPLLLAGLLFSASCVAIRPNGDDGLKVAILTVTGVGACNGSSDRCLRLVLANSSDQVISFPAISQDGYVSLMEPNYVFEGLKREQSDKWEHIALSVGDFVESATTVKIGGNQTHEILVDFPEAMPMAWLYSKFRISIRDVSGEWYISPPFDESGQPMPNHKGTEVVK